MHKNLKNALLLGAVVALSGSVNALDRDGQMNLARSNSFANFGARTSTEAFDSLEALRGVDEATAKNIRAGRTAIVEDAIIDHGEFTESKPTAPAVPDLTTLKGTDSNGKTFDVDKYKKPGLLGKPEIVEVMDAFNSNGLLEDVYATNKAGTRLTIKEDEAKAIGAIIDQYKRELQQLAERIRLYEARKAAHAARKSHLNTVKGSLDALNDESLESLRAQAQWSSDDQQALDDQFTETLGFFLVPKGEPLGQDDKALVDQILARFDVDLTKLQNANELEDQVNFLLSNQTSSGAGSADASALNEEIARLTKALAQRDAALSAAVAAQAGSTSSGGGEGDQQPSLSGASLQAPPPAGQPGNGALSFLGGAGAQDGGQQALARNLSQQSAGGSTVDKDEDAQDAGKPKQKLPAGWSIRNGKVYNHKQAVQPGLKPSDFSDS